MPKLYTVESLAEHFSKHTKTIRMWIEEGLFPNARKIKGGWYVPESDVTALFTKQQESMPGLERRPKIQRGKGFVNGW